MATAQRIKRLQGAVMPLRDRDRAVSHTSAFVLVRGEAFKACDASGWRSGTLSLVKVRYLGGTVPWRARWYSGPDRQGRYWWRPGTPEAGEGEVFVRTLDSEQAKEDEERAARAAVQAAEDRRRDRFRRSEVVEFALIDRADEDTLLDALDAPTNQGETQ